jgi:hypothetical protein
MSFVVVNFLRLHVLTGLTRSSCPYEQHLKAHTQLTTPEFCSGQPRHHIWRLPLLSAGPSTPPLQNLRT